MKSAIRLIPNKYSFLQEVKSNFCRFLHSGREFEMSEGGKGLLPLLPLLLLSREKREEGLGIDVLSARRNIYDIFLRSSSFLFVCSDVRVLFIPPPFFTLQNKELKVTFPFGMHSNTLYVETLSLSGYYIYSSKLLAQQLSSEAVAIVRMKCSTHQKISFLQTLCENLNHMIYFLHRY